MKNPSNQPHESKTFAALVEDLFNDDVLRSGTITLLEESLHVGPEAGAARILHAVKEKLKEKQNEFRSQ